MIKKRTALNIDNEIIENNTNETLNNDEINQTNDQYHEELLKNQETDEHQDNIDETSHINDDNVDSVSNELNDENHLKEFGVDSDTPDLFSSDEDKISSINNDDQEDDLEIPAFLRRQKN